MIIPHSNPSAAGVDPEGILAFIDAVAQVPGLEPHGLIIQRHGQRIAEGYWAPHAADRSRLLYSLSKTFTGTALALQLGEGRLALDDLVSRHLPEAFEGAHEGLRALRIRHIASMATGHDRETIAEARALDPDNLLRGFLRIAPAAPPGTLFAYNQPPVLALATILQRLAGQRLVDYLRPRLFDPLGIGQMRSQQVSPGIDPGYTGIYTTLDAVARLGQLYLQDGRWDGRPLLPEAWVRQAASAQVSNAANTEPDWRQGYGFQLWCSRHGYRGDGAFGQYMVVLPAQQAVIAMFSCTQDMQRVLDLMWAHLLPAMHPAPLPACAADRRLAERLAALALPTAAEHIARGPAPSPAQVPARLDDVHAGDARIAGAYMPGASTGIANEHRSITGIHLDTRGIVLHEGERTLRVPCERHWARNDEGTVATSVARDADGRIAIHAAMLATPHRLEIKLDPAARTFTAHWPVLPIFGAGIGRHLSGMVVPD